MKPFMYICTQIWIFINSIILLSGKKLKSFHISNWNPLFPHCWMSWCLQQRRKSVCQKMRYQFIAPVQKGADSGHLFIKDSWSVGSFEWVKWDIWSISSIHYYYNWRDLVIVRRDNQLEIKHCKRWEEFWSPIRIEFGNKL